MKIKIIPYTLFFKQAAGTSRGSYLEHKVWFVSIYSRQNPSQYGIGECAPLQGLSCDDLPNYEALLSEQCLKLQEEGALDVEALRPYPSMLFGLETALQHLKSASLAFSNSAFAQGTEGIKINGLIWMGTHAEMFEQIKQKIAAGFACLKLKIGAIDFEQELQLLHYIRKHFSANEIQLRVDANGAFKPAEALEKLKRLSPFDLHSIEQPIAAGQWDEMTRLAAANIIPIALDEELIGCHCQKEKEKLLSQIAPQYIVLKPSLHGGIMGCSEWIKLAESKNIAWWATSALESNIGLNAIAQWVSTQNKILPQGLGTGALYTNNIPSPLILERDVLYFNPHLSSF
ncbi:o-succinylbenzoate synthase [Bacteroidales bacterium]|nr:o-succinylbenzoate synthase [Bacteroidales bacterium]